MKSCGLVDRIKFSRPYEAVAVGPAHGWADQFRRMGSMLISFGLPFALVLYLGLRSGGFDVVVYSEIGIGAWWLLLLGWVAGIIDTRRIGRRGWVLIGLLTAFAAWTALAVLWSDSVEQTVQEAGRVAAYLGVFVLVLSVGSREGLKHAAAAVGSAIAVISIIALLSRLHPGWFPRSVIADFIPGAQSRLSYPLDYWNAVAGLVAMGIPLMLWLASSAWSLVARALAAALIPAMCLTIYFTLSRGGIIAACTGTAVLIALYPRRAALLPTLLSAGLGAVALVVLAGRFEDLGDGLLTDTANSQGTAMIVATVIVGVLVALIHVAVDHDPQRWFVRRRRLQRRTVVVGLVVAACAVLIAGIALGEAGRLADAYDSFRAPVDPGTSSERFDSAGGNGRYQYWEAAVDAGASSPVLGIGPGTWQYWWNENGTIYASVRDAHSLYVETFAELGIPGLLLIVAFVATALAMGFARTRRASSTTRALLAAAAGGAAAFAFGAGIDWFWEMPVLPMAFLLLTAVLVGGGVSERDTHERHDASLGARIGKPALAVVGGAAALSLIAIPMLGTTTVRESQRLAAESNPTAALAKARDAIELQPYSASARMQEALLLEQLGRLGPAARSAQRATEEEPTNWQTWFVLSRIEAKRVESADDRDARERFAKRAAAAYERAAELNPRSPLFSS